MTESASYLQIDSEHIDQYGHVNYKGILPILEGVQDEVLARVGTSFDAVEKVFQLRSFVKKVEITWHGELKKDDLCKVLTRIDLGNTSIKLHQTIEVEEVPVVEMFMVVVFVDGVGKPTAIPNQLSKQLSGKCKEDDCKKPPDLDDAGSR